MRAERISLSKAIEREPLPQFYQRVRNGGARKPLRSLRELADEFGVPYKTLQAKLARCKDAPKPIYSTGSSKTASQQNTWYDPDEVRAWWASLEG
jgi:Zn-dependent peptidase ImmA (M78 family)